MQDFINSNPNDEIELREYFITLWAYKIFIIGACALGIMLSISILIMSPESILLVLLSKWGKQTITYLFRVNLVH
jgi:LPS O-antigen subunit length determinant protein (WzzB/FepE family)